jgi:hypothetical protein
MMKVAWHEVPGKSADTRRPVGNGMIRFVGDNSFVRAGSSTFESQVHLNRGYKTFHTFPYGTARNAVSRHCVPGLRQAQSSATFAKSLRDKHAKLRT